MKSVTTGNRKNTVSTKIIVVAFVIVVTAICSGDGVAKKQFSVFIAIARSIFTFITVTIKYCDNTEHTFTTSCISDEIYTTDFKVNPFW